MTGPGGMAEALRIAVVDALERRAAAQAGEARRLIAQRAEQLRAGSDAAPAEVAITAPAPHRGALAGLTALVDRLGRMPATPARGAVPARPATTAARAASPAPLKAVAAFQGTWSRLRAEQRLRQALAQVPAQAGPLNSSHLVHQVLREMHQLSPAYLDAFMAHVDTLLRLEQTSGGGARPVRKG